MKHILTSIMIVALTFFNTCASSTQMYNSKIESGGLGLSRMDWERAYGKVKWEDDGQVLFEGEKGRFIVWFWDGNAGQIIKSEDGTTVTLDEAREESRRFIPLDSKFIRTEKGGLYIIDYYQSESLKGRFASDSWRHGQPGEFQISYKLDNELAKDFGVEIGRPVNSLNELKSKP